MISKQRPCATIGIRLCREYIGRGYGTDEMPIIVDYDFPKMGPHRIQLTVAPFNQIGICAHEKAGLLLSNPAVVVASASRSTQHPPGPGPRQIIQVLRQSADIDATHERERPHVDMG